VSPYGKVPLDPATILDHHRQRVWQGGRPLKRRDADRLQRARMPWRRGNEKELNHFL